MGCPVTPYEGTEPYIFFSYSHKDSREVYPILEQLVRDGYRVWYDAGSRPGDDWPEVIAQHLNDCALFLAVISQSSADSHNCRSEVSYALQCRKKVMAILMETFAMSRGMKMQLSTIHHLNREDYADLHQLLEELYQTQEAAACLGTPQEGSASAGDVLPKTYTDFRRKIDEEVKRRLAEMSRQQEEARKQEEAEAGRQAQEEAQRKREEEARLQAEAEARQREEAEAKQKAEKEEARRKAEEIRRKIEEEARRIQEEARRRDEEMRRKKEEEARRRAEEEKQAQEPPHRTDFISADAEPMPLLLLIRLRDHSVYSFETSRVSIGRSKRCDVVIGDNLYVGKHHVDLLQDREGCTLADRQSRNGTFCRGRRLESGEEVALGDCSLFRLYNESFLLLRGAAATAHRASGIVGFLMNPATMGVRTISEDGLVLGRHHIWEDDTLNDSKIGRNHAAVARQADGIYLKDFGSVNGTFLNQRRLEPHSLHKLQDGDTLCLGDTVLQFCLAAL